MRKRRELEMEWFFIQSFSSSSRRRDDNNNQKCVQLCLTTYWFDWFRVGKGANWKHVETGGDNGSSVNRDRVDIHHPTKSNMRHGACSHWRESSKVCTSDKHLAYSFLLFCSLQAAPNGFQISCLRQKQLVAGSSAHFQSSRAPPSQIKKRGKTKTYIDFVICI
jgi:hypothetical protein